MKFSCNGNEENVRNKGVEWQDNARRPSFFRHHKPRETSFSVSRYTNLKSPPSVCSGSALQLSHVFVSIVKPSRDASRPRLELPCLLLIPSENITVTRDRFIFDNPRSFLTVIQHWTSKRNSHLFYSPEIRYARNPLY
jgi:hypothetical protein